MLMNDFYTVLQQQNTDGAIEASIRFNKAHSIFNGHFPNLPIVPGVCMVQLTRELLEHAVNKKLQLQEAGTIKFLSVINPEETPEVNITIAYSFDGSTYSAQASITKDEITCFKFKGTYHSNGNA